MLNKANWANISENTCTKPIWMSVQWTVHAEFVFNVTTKYIYPHSRLVSTDTRINIVCTKSLNNLNIVCIDWTLAKNHILTLSQATFFCSWCRRLVAWLEMFRWIRPGIVCTECGLFKHNNALYLLWSLFVCGPKHCKLDAVIWMADCLHYDVYLFAFEIS